MTFWFQSDGLKLAGHIALPENRQLRDIPGVVLCPGFPSVANGGMSVAERIYPLANRVAQNLEWAGLVLNYRGCGPSEGDFDLDAWVRDVLSAVVHLEEMEQVDGVWLAGFGVGGSLALCAAQRHPGVKGVATLGAPADFTQWGLAPDRAVSFARSLGIISNPDFPESLESWSKAARSIRADHCAADLSSRPILVAHGSDDLEVSQMDARAIADAHGEAELRILSGAGHRLYSDPRAIAILLGWLDSQHALAG